MKRSLFGGLAAIAALMAAPAMAADMPLKASPYSAAYGATSPVWTWTGCYVGIEGGATWGHTQIYDYLVSGYITNPFNQSGGLFGGTVGCNYQFNGNWVVGVEDDLSWTNNQGSATNLAVATTTNTLRENWIDTLRGRAGIAVGNWLFYGTAGAAFVNTKLTVVGTAGTFSETQTLTGWTAGGGAEWGFNQHWSLKAEYLYIGLGNPGYTSMPSPPIDPRRLDNLNMQLVRLGLNFRF